MLVVPPPIGRYYFLDLRPGRSFVEYSVSRGLQTFLLSWRNPGPEQADWDIDTYAERILTAIDAVREVTGSQDVNVIGFCAGGILQHRGAQPPGREGRRPGAHRVLRRHAARLRAVRPDRRVLRRQAALPGPVELRSGPG